MTSSLHFTAKALRQRGDTIRLPQAFIALCNDPRARDHVGTIDIDAAHRCTTCGGDGAAGLPEDGDVCPACLGTGKRQDEVGITVRMAMPLTECEWFAANERRLPEDVRRRVHDQLWLRAVLTLQRKHCQIGERQAYDRRADEILAVLDPTEGPHAQ